MQVHTLDKAGLVNELTLGSGINNAVNQGRRADFALLVSLFSNDVRDNTPVEQVDEIEVSDQILREQFELAKPQQLRSDQDSYARSATQAQLFHQGSITGAHLAHQLQPDALCYMPEDTCDLPEEVYHNLSNHERTSLTQTAPKAVIPQDIYKQMAAARLNHQIQMQA
ncbi:VC2046/SO_2500 family protein [Vibrio sp. SCSIO 43136]|uniref:VC2046/SO_2500 family protein n=1 Tax=Vibrio sp. SCSIO 43136 TaxID=2819101 RepID=UPI002074C923|nr:VC2046/SO_2500 family protein [Vibrio sp. SCSIO 43136]USD66085.1 hypothetical protein J4N39_04490 [Vibrio sp. SCSIO 43136]